MKICFVVLAHHQPQMFRRLIRNISWENSDIVVHVDRRSDMNKFSISGLANVHFIKNRKRVHWSGWSQTRTICEALEYGLKVSAADYFLLLAGTDFPIQRREVITAFLSEHYPINFINWYPLVPGIWGYGLINRYRFNDLKASSIDIRGQQISQASVVRRVLGTLAITIEKILNAFFQPRNTTWTNFYSGSSRWCLNRETVRFVVDYYRSRESKKLRNYLRLCSNSDEIFFQTAILNSKHKEQCLGFDECAARAIFTKKRPPMPDEMRVYLHYIDWSPEREDPAIMVESDFQRLKDSEKFFACKFMDDKSLGLVKLIEREVLGAN